MEHPISCLSRKLHDSERNHSTIEKEALALFTSVRAFSPYFGAEPVTVWIDHSPLRYIETMSNNNAKFTRCSLELQRYCLNVQHRPGKLYMLPDLSRPASALPWSLPYCRRRILSDFTFADR